jgi:hypothetical protein
MRTVRTKVYEFEELSETAKQTAIEKERNNVYTDFIYDEAYKTVKAFNSVFKIQEGNRSWLDANFTNIDEDVQELKGFRLQKYIWNNFGNDIFKPKYLKHGELTDKRKPYHAMQKQREITNNCPNKGKFYISYYSNIQKENSCVLTGVCYDQDILDPIYNFLEKRDFSNCTINFYHLINNCFEALKKSIESEVDYQNSDEAIIENLISNDYEFTKDGFIFNA